MATPDRPRPARQHARVTPPPLPGTIKPRPPVTAPPPGEGEVPEKPSYFKFAFANPYNLALLGGSLAAAALTLNPLIALAGLGLETIWLVNADNQLLRRFVWDPKFDKMRREAEAAARAARMLMLSEWDRTRVENLVARQTDIHRLAAQNPSLTGDLLRSELTKTDKLVEAFMDMAVTSARYEAYLASVDLTALDADRARLERDVKFCKDDDPQLELLKKNLAIILKRQDKMREIRRYLDVARGQLDLIENSFQLIADQIVTMQSPQALSGQLDELLDGVETIRQTAREADALLEA
ncbi:MAG: hypothetical protein EHM24_11415 [Acidobacteria bacterium]|nr:MAG: hypothetical protein EHM24_11415 [Acidobacteriota bacterium]